MNVVFSIRFFISSMTTICLIVMPRVLYYFGLRAEALDLLMSPWATWLVLVFVGILIAYPLLKNIKFAIPIIIGILIVTAMLTFYFCELSLPW